MKHLKRIINTLGLLGLLTLSACGGGGGASGTSPLIPPTTGPSGAASVADLALVLSAPTIANNGSAQVTVTVTALDVNRNTVASAPVTLAADSDAVVSIVGNLGSVTNSSGVVQASVGIGANTALRAITLTAVAGNLKKTATLQVVSSASGNLANVVDVIAAATTAGTGGDNVLITAFVKDANNNALFAAPVSFKTDTGTLSNISTSTNTAGAATASFSAGVDRTNRTATITVSSGAIVKSLSLPITGTKLTLSGPTSLTVGGKARFEVLATDSKGAVINGLPVVASSSLLNALAPTGSLVTDSGGLARFDYTASRAGSDTLVFAAGGATVSPSPGLSISAQSFSFISPASSAVIDVDLTSEACVQLLDNGNPQAGQAVRFSATSGTTTPASSTTDASGRACTNVKSQSAGPLTLQATAGSTSTTLPLLVTAKNPSAVTLQISPNAIPPNTSASSSNIATVQAKVTDKFGNPVQGATVNFTRTQDNSGGNLLQASAVTDASGVALVTYRSGGQTTASNGVELQASVVGASPAVEGKASLTVNQAALFIALGTGNIITNLNPQTYKKDWVVYVTDANGIPVNGATLTVKATPTHYRTGTLAWDGIAYVYSSNVKRCDSEDRNQDGVLNVGEDDNADGVLWPGNVISVTPGTVQTVNGIATISLLYAESYAPWVDVKLTASASVAGTESKTSVEFTVQGSADDFTSLPNPPAGLVSPFGTSGAASTCKPLS